MKEAILKEYVINEETHHRHFQGDECKTTEAYREWATRLKEKSYRWKKASRMDLEEIMLMEQFLEGVPEDLAVWLKEKKPVTC